MGTNRNDNFQTGNVSLNRLICHWGTESGDKSLIVLVFYLQSAANKHPISESDSRLVRPVEKEPTGITDVRGSWWRSLAWMTRRAAGLSNSVPHFAFPFLVPPKMRAKSLLPAWWPLLPELMTIAMIDLPPLNCGDREEKNTTAPKEKAKGRNEGCEESHKVRGMSALLFSPPYGGAC